MPFSIRKFRRLPASCPVMYSRSLAEGSGTVWNLSASGFRFSGDLPLQIGDTCSLTVTLPNEQRIVVPEAVVRWSRGQEFAVETVMVERHTQARLWHYVKRLVQAPTESIS